MASEESDSDSSIYNDDRRPPPSAIDDDGGGGSAWESDDGLPPGSDGSDSPPPAAARPQPTIQPARKPKRQPARKRQPAEADRVADQSADESAPGKRKATGHKKKAKKKKGGYTDKGRIAFKSEGGVLVTGHARTCLPDALFLLLHSLSLVTDDDKDNVQVAIMGDDLYKDALFTTAQTYVKSFGLSLPGVTAEFNTRGGLAYNLLNAKGRKFIVHLLVSFGPHDKDPDDHCVAYDGITVRDNNKYKKVKVLDDGDRSSPDMARNVFDSLYPKMMVRIKNVFELLRA